MAQWSHQSLMVKPRDPFQGCQLHGFTRLPRSPAMDEFGLAYDERAVVEGTYEESSGRDGMEQLLRRNISFTGLVCANDVMAAGAIAIAREHGIEIPDDLSVIGFDNVFFTRYMHPQLSTINYPIEVMGKMAARCVLRDVYGQPDQEIQLRFMPELVRRESIAELA